MSLMGVVPINKVMVHPVVLLSVVDHCNRMAKIGHQKRVVGVLLGGWQSKGVVDVSSSFAVAFDEDDKDQSVWFLDIEYLEQMYSMFKKINAKERIVGWYHTDTKLHGNDIAINEMMQKYTPNSVLVLVDVNPHDLDLPTKAYVTVQQVSSDGSRINRTFDHVLTQIVAEEVEEVGVEHLLRDIKATTASSIAGQVTNQLKGLKGLHMQLRRIKAYLSAVEEGKLPINNDICYLMQEIFSLLPNIINEQFMETLTTTTNDQMLLMYLGAMVRSVIGLHGLIDNKLTKRECLGEKKSQPNLKKKEQKASYEDGNRRMVRGPMFN